MKCYTYRTLISLIIFIYLAAPGLSYGTREFWSLAAGMQTLSCGMWDLAPRPGMESRPSALGGRSLSHWITREVPLTVCLFFLIVFMDVFKSPSEVSRALFRTHLRCWVSEMEKFLSEEIRRNKMASQASQLAQWQRIHLLIQEPQET